MSTSSSSLAKAIAHFAMDIFATLARATDLPFQPSWRRDESAPWRLGHAAWIAPPA